MTTILLPDKITPPPLNSQASSAGSSKQLASGSSGFIPNQYIVVFKDQGNGLINKNAAEQAKELTNTLIRELGISNKEVKNRYEYALKGFTAKLNKAQIKALKRNPRIDHITQDHTFDFAPSSTGISLTKNLKQLSSGSQNIPWGVNRVTGPLDGTGKTAWILDTGIDLDHPDLNVDVANSASFVADESANDIQGHGTHVAGIIAAKNNSRDVVGVASGASVVAVKVLHDNPNENLYSEIVDGVDYVASKANPGDIVNMSLGDPTPDNSEIDNAIINAANNGIRFVISAGNESQNAGNVTPARAEHSNVWTVSAYDDTDTFASFSNYGNPPIEYGGPGVGIFSLDKNGNTTTKNGTSMAAPHIAGLLLAADNGITTDGTVSGDPDGNPDPIAVANIDQPLGVQLNGPPYVNSGQTAGFIANVSNAEGSVNYQWYYRKEPYASWMADGGNSSTYSHTFYSAPGGETAHSAVKVVVTSAGETASAIHSIDVYGCQQGISKNSASTNIIIPC